MHNQSREKSTRCNVSVLSYDTLKAIKRRNNVEIEESNLELLSASGTKMENVGQVRLQIKIGKSKITRIFQIGVGIAHSIILGWNTIQEEGFIIDGGKKELRIRTDIIPLDKDGYMTS